MDSLDKRIIAVLREDARTPVAEVARQVSASRATVHERLKRLTENGVIKGATLRLDPAALGRPFHVLVMVEWNSQTTIDETEAARRMTKIPGVERVHFVTGRSDFVVEVLAQDLEEIGEVVSRGIRSVPGVRTTETVHVFWTVEGEGIPLE